MQQPKRRSKRGVILLAVVVALLVLVALPAAALAAETVSVNNGASFSGDINVSVTYKSDNAAVTGVTFSDRAAPPAGVFGAFVSETSPIKAYAGGNSATSAYTLRATPLTDDSNHQVRVSFYVGLTMVAQQVSQVFTLDFAGPPISVLNLDPDAGWHPGRGDIWWTNGDDALHGPGDVYGTFGQMWDAPMGITHWVVTKNSDAPIVETPLTWAPWGTTSSVGATVEIVDEPNPFALINPKPRYSADGVYQITHWATDIYSQRQVTDSYDTFGYDTKAPYVVWQWPATTTGYYTSNIKVNGDIIDDGGSGVAGFFAFTPLLGEQAPWIHFSPTATVMWKSAETGGNWEPWLGWGVDHHVTSIIKSEQKPLSVQVNAFDHYSWHVSGDIYVRPYYNAEYAVWVTGSDYAGNDGFPLHDWWVGEAPSAATARAADAAENTIGWGIPGQGVVVDNMAPSTIASGSPASAVVTANGIGTWTNKDVTVTFTASDAGGSGIGSGVAYTEYILGNSSTTPPALSATGTKGDSVTIKDQAPVGPVYLWFRSVDNVGNKEAWNLAWVYIANKAPVLSIGGSSPWYNDKSGVTLLGAFVQTHDFNVVLAATANPTKQLAPPGIEYQVPNWPMPFLLPHTGTLVPTTWTPLSQNPGMVWFPVDPYPNSRTDGIWPLNFRATDMAGNSATNTTATVKIDTRPPTTAGAATYGQAQWYNGTKPYVLTATDQNPGAGVAVTWYRADQATPWTASVATTPTATFDTSVNIASPAQGSVHTIDFFSIDNSTYQVDGAVTTAKYPGNVEKGVVVGWAPIPSHPYVNITSVAGYKTTTVKADVTAPAVTAMDPKNGNWQKPLATVNFSGTDVGSGYNHTEWSTDGGKTWTSGEQAQVGGDGVITITYHGVDNVGIVSANQTIEVKVASTPPTVTAQNSSAKSGARISITFNITAVTPQATAIIQIRTLSGKTLSTHNYASVATGSDQTRTFTVSPKLKPGKYNIRVGAQDMAGNIQTKRGSAKLTITK